MKNKQLRSIKIIGVLLAIIAFQCIGTSQTAKPVQLPGKFSKFQKYELLNLIYEGYDPKTSTTSKIPNQKNEPSYVSIMETRIWHMGENEYLAVVTVLEEERKSEKERKLEEEQKAELDWNHLCLNCMRYFPVAIFTIEDGRLKLIAKQDLPQVTNYKGILDSDEFSAYSSVGGYSIALDLAPYRLRENEFLLGLRDKNEIDAYPKYEITLVLFRVEQGKLRRIFDGVVFEKLYYRQQSEDEEPNIDKTIYTLSNIPGIDGFFDLSIRKRSYSCDPAAGDCGYRDQSPKKRAAARWLPTKFIGYVEKTERWMFDGKKYVDTNSQQ